MLNGLSADQKKSKYSKLLSELIQHMAEKEHEDESMEASESEADEMKEGDGPMASEGEEPPEELVSKEESQDDDASDLPDEELSEEDRAQLLKSRNTIPKKAGTVTMAFMSKAKDMAKSKSKGRPKGSKSRY